MQVSFILDHPQNVWTNLDSIKGKVNLRLPNTASISSIVVKMEGESKTKLLAPVRDIHDRPVPKEEIHKVSLFWSRSGWEGECCAWESRAEMWCSVRRGDYKPELCIALQSQ